MYLCIYLCIYLFICSYLHLRLHQSCVLGQLSPGGHIWIVVHQKYSLHLVDLRLVKRGPVTLSVGALLDSLASLSVEIGGQVLRAFLGSVNCA